MKKYGAIILILGIILYLSYMLFAQDNIFNTGQRDIRAPRDQNNQSDKSNQSDQSDKSGQSEQIRQSEQNDPSEPLDKRNDAADQGNPKAVEPQKMDFNGNESGSEDVEDENYLADDQEIFARKLFQKKLTPLANQEKIIWAFRLSKTTIFL